MDQLEINPLRPGKRPRNAGIEGSTVAVPDPINSTSSNDDTTSPFLVKLAESCSKHKGFHDNKEESNDESALEEDELPQACVKTLNSLRNVVLPKILPAFHPTQNPKASDLRNVCDFYVNVIYGTFCPSSLRVFDFGRNPHESKD